MQIPGIFKCPNEWKFTKINKRKRYFKLKIFLPSYKVIIKNLPIYTQSEAWSGVNWADLMAAQGAFGTDFYGRSTRTIVGTRLRSIDLS